MWFDPSRYISLSGLLSLLVIGAPWTLVLFVIFDEIELVWFSLGLVLLFEVIDVLWLCAPIYVFGSVLCGFEARSMP